MTQRPLKIAYLCDITPLDANLYSGGNTRMYKALRQHAGEVTIISNSWHLGEPLRRLIHRLPEAINLRARWRVHLMLRKLIARGLRKELQRGGFDVVFCAYSFQSLAGLNVPSDMISAFTADATPTTYKRSSVGQSFGSFLSISRYFDPWVARQERRILDGTEVLLWPSEWMREGVCETHGALGAQTHVVPWGANVDPVPDCPSSAPIQQGAPVELLFMGRDWFAKGGPVARDVLLALRARGIAARLTVIGVTPPDDHLDPDMRVEPSLDKSKPADMARFAELFRNAHFLINPSFESYGFAFCEASAYGLPALCYRVGGVPVRDGINGHALPMGAKPDAFAQIICDYLAKPQTHADLRQSARREYEERLNWDAWGRKVATLLADAVRTRSADQ